VGSSTHGTGHSPDEITVHGGDYVRPFVFTTSAIRFDFATDPGLSIEHKSNYTIRMEYVPD
jgi:hypothetical protein